MNFHQRLHHPAGQRAPDAAECPAEFIEFLAGRYRISPRYTGQMSCTPHGRYYARISKRTLYQKKCSVLAGEILIPTTQLDLIRFSRQVSSRWLPIVQVHRGEAIGILIDRKIVNGGTNG